VIPEPGQRSVVITSPQITTDDEHGELLRVLEVTNQIVVPLVADNHHLGTVSFARVAGAKPFREADILVAEDLVRRAAIAIDNARLYESARAANRAKDEFLGTLSHELRSPLNAVLGWTQLLSHGLPEAQWAKALQAIERNASAQAALIDDLLDMSRIVSGVMRIEVGPIELRGMVEVAVDSIKPQLDAKGIIVRPMSLRRTPLVGDASRLQQVICNLLGNAMKFTPAGGHIEITLVETDGKVSLVIADDGKGIDPKFLPHVFERFKQADGSTSRAHGGLGLGLAISRHLVELHGGTIVAESAGEGRGTRVTVTLPGLTPAAVDSAAKHRDRAQPTGALGGLVILVVDDEPDAREMLVLLLEQFGASVIAACSAAEALAAVAQVRPDIVLSDLGMPGEDGYSLIRRLRANPTNEGGAIPAIAVSGFAALEDRQRALAAGFQRHVAKPVNLPDLLSSITSLRPPSRA
jgi:signal transduction histidine kinase